MPISDLTGCTWTGNSFVYVSSISGNTFAINFTDANNTSYSALMFTARYIRYDSTNVYDDGAESWKNIAYQTITFTGGTDATNSTLIAWLEANGTLVAPQPSASMSIGASSISKMILGNTEVSKVFLGSVKIYEKAASSYQIVVNMSSGYGITIYDGQDSSGTELYNGYSEQETVTCTTGYLYFEGNLGGQIDTVTVNSGNATATNPTHITGNAEITVHAYGGGNG